MGGDHIAGLYRTWGPAIYRRCLRLLRDPEAARDATQEVFRKALSSPSRLADPDTALPFIYRVATNHCLNERCGSLRGPHRSVFGAQVSPRSQLVVQGQALDFRPKTQDLNVRP